MSAVTRTVTLDDLTPEEVAVLFAGMDSLGQAAFFAKVWDIAKLWPGAGWCIQACSIAESLDDDGLATVNAIAEHIALRAQSDLVRPDGVDAGETSHD